MVRNPPEIVVVANTGQHFRKRIKIHPHAIEDIYDGEKYKELSLPGNFLSHPNNIFLKLWTDGIQLTKSPRTNNRPSASIPHGACYNAHQCVNSSGCNDSSRSKKRSKILGFSVRSFESENSKFHHKSVP